MTNTSIPSSFPSPSERSQKQLLKFCDLNLLYGRLSLKGWESILFAAEGKLDHHPIPRSRDPAQRAVSRLEAYFGSRHDAPAWIARPGQGVHFVVPDRKITSGHHMSDAGIFVRPCSKSRGWVIRSLSSRKLVASRIATAVRCSHRDPNTRHAQLALSDDDLVGRHGSLDTSPSAYRASVRESLYAPLIADGPPTGVLVALVLARDVDGDHVDDTSWSPSGGGLA